MQTIVGSQAEYARHANISKQAVSKGIKQGKIPTRPDGRIDFAEADRARRQNGDPARRMAEAGELDGTVHSEPPDKDTNDLELEKAATETGGLSYSEARTEREAIQAKIAQLDYEARLGQLLPRQQVEEAMVASGRKIRQGLDGVVGWSEELDAAARNGGADAVRAVLKDRVRALETMIVESLNLLADDDT